jgi:hypothetical protein
VYAALEYARVTGDSDIFDAKAPLIEQRAPGPDEHSVYETPVRLPVEISLFDHCARAIARTLETGVHGLPLMGTGDWNDGMDEVGAQGHGESVWLGWFLASILGPFADLTAARGDASRASAYRAHAARLTDALDRAWDGEWYRRAYFDDGTPLGSKESIECRIDSIAQSWSVISGLAHPEKARRAMESVEQWLVDRASKLVLLLAPPFDRAEPSPGYIRGYVPGVRENGGQYTHAVLWVVLAHLLLGRGDAAHELLSFANPIHRSADREGARRYRVEPFVVAADIYSAPAHVGRGGWTWYTGAAGWMYRITLEHLLGLKREAEWLIVDPCVPSGWRTFSVTLRIDGAKYRVEVDNSEGAGRGVRSLTVDGQPVDTRRIRLERGSGAHVVGVVIGPASPNLPVSSTKCPASDAPYNRKPRLTRARAIPRLCRERAGIQTGFRRPRSRNLRILVAGVRAIGPHRQEPGVHQHLKRCLAHRAIDSAETLHLFRSQRQARHLEVFGANALENLGSGRFIHDFNPSNEDCVAEGRSPRVAPSKRTNQSDFERLEPVAETSRRHDQAGGTRRVLAMLICANAGSCHGSDWACGTTKGRFHYRNWMVGIRAQSPRILIVGVEVCSWALVAADTGQIIQSPWSIVHNRWSTGGTGGSVRLRPSLTLRRTTVAMSGALWQLPHTHAD